MINYNFYNNKRKEDKMKNLLLTLAAIVIIIVANQKVFSQSFYVIELNEASFSPAELTINVGDTIYWQSMGYYNHNVVADDSSFYIGDLSSGNWLGMLVLETPGIFQYYCSIHGGPGGVGMSGVITVENATEVKDDYVSISKFDLIQNYPNPFNPSTSIQYKVSSISTVSLKVYDVLGNEVATLVNEEKPAGSYEVDFDASGLSSGIYFYKLSAGSLVETKKMILMK